MEYYCHIWAGAAGTALSSFDRVQKRFRVLVGDEIFSNLSITGRMWQTSRCSIATFMQSAWENYIHWFRQA